MSRAWSGLVALLILLAMPAACGRVAERVAARRHPPQTVVAARARAGTLPELLHLTGQVHAGRRAAVSAAVAGRVVRVDAREGEPVRAGQPLVWLDTRAQEAQIAVQQAAVQQARARLGQLEAQYGMTVTGRRSDVQKAREGVTQADLAVQQAQARLETAEVDMKRKQELLAAKAVAKSDYETAVLNFHLSRDALATARSQATQAREALRLARVTASDQTVHEADVVSARAEVDQAVATLAASRTTLEQMVLHAPISGTVVSRRLETGQAVTPGGEPLVQIVDLQGSWVTAVVSQSEVSRLRPGMEAEVVLAQFPSRRLKAVLKRLVPAADPATSTVQINLALQAPPAGLLDQAPASVRVRVGSQEGVLVPKVAVLGEKRNLHVVVVHDGKAQRRPARVVMMDQNYALLSEGVQAGETVVTQGGQFLDPGDPVRLVPEAPRARNGPVRR